MSDNDRNIAETPLARECIPILETTHEGTADGIQVVNHQY